MCGIPSIEHAKYLAKAQSQSCRSQHCSHCVLAVRQPTRVQEASTGLDCGTLGLREASASRPGGGLSVFTWGDQRGPQRLPLDIAVMRQHTERRPGPLYPPMAGTKLLVCFAWTLISASMPPVS